MDKTTKYISIIIIAIIVIAIIGVLVWQGKKPLPVVVQKTTPTIAPTVTESPLPTLTPTPTPEAVKWTKYTSKTLGFSISMPEKVYGFDGCDSSDNFLVPLKAFEDNVNNAAYIVPEYYYDNYYGSDIKNPKPGISNCETKTYSLQLAKDETQDKGLDGKYIASSGKPFLGIAIRIKNIKNDTELNKFIKDNYGSGCLMESKTLWPQQSGVYEIILNAFKDAKGNDTDLGSTVCPVNYVYKILYSPEKSKAMLVKLGQECNFQTNPANLTSYACYDEDMIKSFRFE